MTEEQIIIGTAVIYYSVIIGQEKLYPRQTSIRSEAWALGSGELVCKVDGVAGGVSLEHLELRKPNPYQLFWYKAGWSQNQIDANNSKYWEFEIRHNGLRVP